jgi:photosystem II stability/assembly factor-like uncharacterized protein
MKNSLDRQDNNANDGNNTRWLSYLMVGLFIVSLTVLITSCDPSNADNNPFSFNGILTNNPSPTATKTSPTPRLQHAAALQTLNMLDASSGWALTADKHVLRTTNGVGMWEDVTPVINWDHYRVSVLDFLDKNHAWVGVEGAGKFSLFSTNDGGNIWIESPVPEPDPNATIARIDFVDEDEGWLLFDKVTTNGHQLVDIFTTPDNGETWLAVASNDTRQRLKANLLLSASSHVAIQAVDNHTCWVTGSTENTESIALARTQDGGNSWQNVKLTLPAGIGHIKEVMTLQPSFFADNTVLLPVVFSMGDTGETQLYLYTSNDGGSRWQHGNMVTVSTEDVIRLSFVNAQTGWVIGSQAKLWQTTNGGLQWASQAIPNHVTRVTAIQFVSPTQGWILVTDGTTGGTLLQTDDSGQTWTVVHPVAQ